MIGWGNRSTRSKRAPVPLYHKPHMTLPGLESGPSRWEGDVYPPQLRHDHNISAISFQFLSGMYAVFIGVGITEGGKYLARVPQEAIFLYSKASRPALRSIQSRIEWGPWVFPSGRIAKLTTHIHLVPKPKIVELYLPSPILPRVVMPNKLRGL
jgi:hypothetical protein